MILVFAWFCVCMVLVFATEPAMHVAQTLLEINLLPGVAGHKHDVTALTIVKYFILNNIQSTDLVKTGLIIVGAVLLFNFLNKYQWLLQNSTAALLCKHCNTTAVYVLRMSRFLTKSICAIFVHQLSVVADTCMYACA